MCRTNNLALKNELVLQGGLLALRVQEWSSIPEAVNKSLAQCRAIRDIRQGYSEVIGLSLPNVWTLDALQKTADLCDRLSKEAYETGQHQLGWIIKGPGFQVARLEGQETFDEWKDRIQTESTTATPHSEERKRVTFDQRRIEQWTELISHFESLPQLLRRMALTADQSVEVLKKYSAYKDVFPYWRVLDLANSIRPMLDAGREEIAPTLFGSVNSALHSTIDAHVIHAARHPLNYTEGWKRFVEELSDAGHPSEAIAVQTAVENLVLEPSLPALIILKEEVDRAANLFPDPWPVVPAVRNVSSSSSDKIRVVSVDDDQKIRDFVKVAADVLRSRYLSTREILFEAFDNAEDARRSMIKDPRQRIKDAPLTIAVVDLGLPATAIEARDLSRTVSSEVGHQLLADLRDYTHNIPCVVLTTPKNSLEDQSRAESQGLGYLEYILKEDEDYLRLPDALERLFAVSTVQTLLIDLEGDPEVKPEFWIDNIRVSVDPSQYKTVCALAKLWEQGPKKFRTKREILVAIDSRYAEEETFLTEAAVEARARFQFLSQTPAPGDWVGDWPPRFREEIAECMVDWAEQKALAKGDLTKAFKGLQASRDLAPIHVVFKLYTERFVRSGKRSMKLAQARETNRWSGWFDEVFGGITTRVAKNEHKVRDDISRVRKAVHEAFKREGRRINSDAFIESRKSDGGASEEGYRICISVERIALEARRGRSARKIHVLIVEDDPIFRDFLSKFLSQLGYLVQEASTAEDAAPETLFFKPDVVCLDLDLPRSSTDTSRTTDAGVPNSHDLIERFQCQWPKVRIICPTSYAEADAVRAGINRCLRKGSPAIDFVSKLDAHWEGRLLRVLNGIRNEILGEDAPIADIDRLPIVKVLPGFDLARGVLALDVDGRITKPFTTSDQGVVIGMLLKANGRLVTTSEIGERLGGDGAEKMKQMRKHLRDRIALDWLGTPKDTSLAKRILEKKKSGLVLHVDVIWPNGEKEVV